MFFTFRWLLDQKVDRYRRTAGRSKRNNGNNMSLFQELVARQQPGLCSPAPDQRITEELSHAPCDAVKTHQRTVNSKVF